MDTRLTVADVRALLYAIINPGDANDPAFLRYLNQVCERLLYSGKWKGAYSVVVFAASDGFITLPREFIAALACQYADRAGMVFSQFHEYIESGPGELDQNATANGNIVDMGDGFCTQTDIPAGSSGTLRVTITVAGDAAKSIRLFGLDADGSEIFSSGAAGVVLTTADPSATTTQVFSKVTDIQAPTMSGSWSLNWMDGTTPEQIGAYQPGETRPRYRRYKTGVSTDDVVLRCLCSRRFVPLSNETDWVWPGNLGALKNALLALKMEDAVDGIKIKEAWDRAYKCLDDEARTFRGGNRPSVPINVFGDFHAIPTST